MDWKNSLIPGDRSEEEKDIRRSDKTNKMISKVVELNLKILINHIKYINGHDILLKWQISKIA